MPVYAAYCPIKKSETLLTPPSLCLDTVIENERLRAYVESGFSIDYQTASDTIDTIRTLCFKASSEAEYPTNDAFEATACTAASIVQISNTADDKCSPIKGMNGANLDWCYTVVICLLITIFHDLKTTKDGYVN